MIVITKPGGASTRLHDSGQTNTAWCDRSFNSGDRLRQYNLAYGNAAWPTTRQHGLWQYNLAYGNAAGPTAVHIFIDTTAWTSS
jgi:hypothetical protein